MTFARLRPLAPRLAFIAACALFAYRFVNRDLVPFILDEPQFLAAARAQLETGRWVTFSPLVGSQGLHYGPTPVWFYGLVHILLGSKPTTHIFAMSVCVTAAHGFLAVQLGRLFDESLTLRAVLVGIVATSPYQFFWSRLAWDQSVNVLAPVVLGLLCTRWPIGARRCIVIGALLGLAVGSHLMVVPFAALVFAFLLYDAVRRRSVVPWFLGVAVAALACSLYLAYLVPAAAKAMPAAGTMAWSDVSQVLLEPFRVSTTQGIEYFFDQYWQQFDREYGDRVGSWLGSQALVAVVACGAVVGLVWTVHRHRSTRARLAWLAIFTWVTYAFLYAWRGLEPHPHYQFPTWWIVLPGVAGLLHELRRVAPGGARLMLAGLAGLIVVQLAFLVSWMRFVRDHGGTGGIHYGATISEQTDVVRRICSVPDKTIQVTNLTRVFDHSLNYVVATEPVCEGKKVRFQPPADPSPSRAPAMPTLRYREAGSGFLTID